MLDGLLYENLAEPGHKVHSEAEAQRAIETLISLIGLIVHDSNKPN